MEMVKIIIAIIMMMMLIVRGGHHQMAMVDQKINGIGPPCKSKRRIYNNIHNHIQGPVLAMI